MIGANIAEHDLSSDVGKKSTDDDFSGKKDNSLSTSSMVGGVIDPNTGPLWIKSDSMFDFWTDGSLAAMLVLILEIFSMKIWQTCYINPDTDEQMKSQQYALTSAAVNCHQL